MDIPQIASSTSCFSKSACDKEYSSQVQNNLISSQFCFYKDIFWDTFYAIFLTSTLCYKSSSPINQLLVPYDNLILICSQQGVDWHNNSNFLHEKSIASSLEIRKKVKLLLDFFLITHCHQHKGTSGNNCRQICIKKKRE